MVVRTDMALPFSGPTTHIIFRRTLLPTLVVVSRGLSDITRVLVIHGCLVAVKWLGMVVP